MLLVLDTGRKELFIEVKGSRAGASINECENSTSTYAPINVMPAGGWGGGGAGHGVWGFDCLCRPWGRAFELSCSPRWGGGGYLNLSSPDVEIFGFRLGRKRLRPNICFPLPPFTHAAYGLERSANHGGQRELAKAGCISLFCLQISFVLVCF